MNELLQAEIQILIYKTLDEMLVNIEENELITDKSSAKDLLDILIVGVDANLQTAENNLDKLKKQGINPSNRFGIS